MEYCEQKAARGDRAAQDSQVHTASARASPAQKRYWLDPDNVPAAPGMSVHGK